MLLQSNLHSNWHFQKVHNYYNKLVFDDDNFSSFRFQIVAYFKLVPGVALIPLQIAKKLRIMKSESIMEN